MMAATGKLLDYVNNIVCHPIAWRSISKHLVRYNIAKAFEQCGRADDALVIQHSFEVIKAFDGRETFARTLRTMFAHSLSTFFTERTHGS